MVAAMIDISTIAVVSIGSLPLHALGNAEEDEIFKHTLYLKPHAHLNLSPSTIGQKDTLEHVILHTCAEDVSPDKYFIPCRVENKRLVDLWSTSTDPQSRLRYKEQYVKARATVNSGTRITTESINDSYCVYDNQLITNEKGAVVEPKALENRMVAGSLEMEKRKCSNINKLITNAVGTSWPLFTLYASIFHMARISLTVNQGDLLEAAINMGMKTVVGFALIIPLIALAVALVVRVVVLWWIIAFSPLLVLAYVFEFKKVEESVQAFSLKNVISLIFLPVFAVFAISMSVIFMTLISNITLIEKTTWPAASAPIQPDGNMNDIFTAMMGNDVKRDCSDAPYGPCCYSILNITEICFSEWDRTNGAGIVNTLSWLLVNFFGIALMRTVIFFVLKSNAVTGQIAGSIEWFGKTLLTSAPIIPIGSGVGIGAVGQALSQVKRNVQTRMDNQYRNSDLAKRIQGQEADRAWDATQKSKQIIEGGQTIDAAEGTANQTFDDYNTVVPHFVSQAKAQDKVTFAKEPEDRKEAFRTPEFVQRTQSKKDGDKTVYDTLYNKRMKSELWADKKKRADEIEEGMGSMITDKTNNIKSVKMNDPLHQENLYRFNGNVTSFARAFDKNGKVEKFDVTTKKLSENGIHSKEELETFQRLLNEKYKSVTVMGEQLGTKYPELLQQLAAPASGAANNQITVTIEGKQYVLDRTISEGTVTGISKIQEVDQTPPAWSTPTTTN